jgi:hypothetical protein
MMSRTLLPLALIALFASACSDSSVAADDEADLREDDLFAKSSALQLSVSAPMQKLFGRYKMGQADPPELGDGGAPRNAQSQFSEVGQLTSAGKTFDVRVYIRGESSRGDCPFPKLKLEFTNKEQLKNSPFKGHGKLRLNTHCGPGDANARSGMGRVFNGVGPVREELQYRMIRAANVATYLTRVAQISYKDTEANTSTETFAMMMETGDDAAKRFAKAKLIAAEGKYLDPNNGDAQGELTPENAAQLDASEGFIGNPDWGGTHNADSFGVARSGKVFRIPQDFDLTVITLGDINNYRPGQAPTSKASTGLRNATVAAQFQAQKQAIEAAIDTAEKDAIAAKAVVSADGAHTNDSGFAMARARVKELYALPELAGAPVAGASDGGVP